VGELSVVLLGPIEAAEERLDAEHREVVRGCLFHPDRFRAAAAAQVRAVDGVREEVAEDRRVAAIVFIVRI
jgi:hypothetical protein